MRFASLNLGGSLSLTLAFFVSAFFYVVKVRPWLFNLCSQFCVSQVFEFDSCAPSLSFFLFFFCVFDFVSDYFLFGWRKMAGEGETIGGKKCRICCTEAASSVGFCSGRD